MTNQNCTGLRHTVAILCGTVAFAVWNPSGHAAEAPLIPVIVELFTSQGCSSCPPADAVLATLERNQPVEGVEIVPLSEHVDYWNRLGWHDPFSSARYSARQRDYGKILNLANLYTPMMIVDGQAALIGSESSKVRRAIIEAAARTKIPVQLNVTNTAASDIINIAASIVVGKTGPLTRTEMWLAITETALATNVMAGENMFRQLRHTGVVRHLERTAAIISDRAKDQTPIMTRVKLDESWKRRHLRVIVFLQDMATRAITGAASASVN